MSQENLHIYVSGIFLFVCLFSLLNLFHYFQWLGLPSPLLSYTLQAKFKMLAYSQAQWAWVSFEPWMGHISQGPGGPATGNFKQSILCIPANLYVQNFPFSAFI